MSILGDIMSAIFGHSASAANPGAATAAPASAPSRTPISKPAGQANVDVAAVLDSLAKQKKQRLKWRSSIVDLMKLLDLDSSVTARKHLAQELHYQGDMKNSAKMNTWLHKQVMVKLAENGGAVPEELRR